MLRQEMRPTTIAVPALRPIKHNLRLARRRRWLAIRPQRNIRPCDSLNPTHQPKLIPSPLLHQLHRPYTRQGGNPTHITQQPTPNPKNPHNPNNPSSDNNPHHRTTPSHTTTVPSPASHLPPPPRGRLRGGPRVRATGRPRGGHHPNKRPNITAVPPPKTTHPFHHFQSFAS